MIIYCVGCRQREQVGLQRALTPQAMGVEEELSRCKKRRAKGRG